MNELPLLAEAPKRDNKLIPRSQPPRATTRTTPQEIVDDINKRPPFQRTEAAKNYIGLKVNWPTVLHRVDPNSNNLASLFMSPSEPGKNIRDKASIAAYDFDITTYPALKLAENGQRLRVVGEISDINLTTTTIRLSNCTVAFE